MIRPIATELGLFLAPFVVYALFLLVRRQGVFDRANWPPKTLLTLAIVAGLFMLSSFFVLAHLTGTPPGSDYEPAHMQDGKFVPGRVVR